MKAFALSPAVESRRATLAKWAELLASGRADDFKEQELLADFLADIFRGILRYASPADCPERFTISREKHVQVDGKFADAVLGNFRPGNEQFIVALEGKGPRDPLERPFAGRRMSAVDQGYRYTHRGSGKWRWALSRIASFRRGNQSGRRVFLVNDCFRIPPLLPCSLPGEPLVRKQTPNQSGQLVAIFRDVGRRHNGRLGRSL